MKSRWPMILSAVLMAALAAPEAGAKDKPKNKEKKKDKVEDVDRHHDGDRDHDGDHDRDHDGDHDRDDDRDASGKITICHVPPGNASARHTITVSESAWDAHRGHGDDRGACGTSHGGDGDQRGTFNRLDTNNDGRLSPGEWKGSSAEFARRDRDRNRFLSFDEYTRY